MEENKYICPNCGIEMTAVYEKPALNLTCSKCGCKIATTKWEEIDLDDTDYEVHLLQTANIGIDEIKTISNITGKNFIESKKMLENGGLLITSKAIEIKDMRKKLTESNIAFRIVPEYPY